MKRIVDHIVQVEEELKALRQTMEICFESMEKRFTTLQWFMGIGFTIISILIAVFGLFVGKAWFHDNELLHCSPLTYTTHVILRTPTRRGTKNPSFIATLSFWAPTRSGRRIPWEKCKNDEILRPVKPGLRMTYDNVILSHAVAKNLLFYKKTTRSFVP